MWLWWSAALQCEGSAWMMSSSASALSSAQCCVLPCLALPPTETYWEGLCSFLCVHVLLYSPTVLVLREFNGRIALHKIIVLWIDLWFVRVCSLPFCLHLPFLLLCMHGCWRLSSMPLLVSTQVHTQIQLMYSNMYGFPAVQNVVSLSHVAYDEYMDIWADLPSWVYLGLVPYVAWQRPQDPSVWSWPG